MAAKDRDSAEATGCEEQLGGDVGFTDFEDDFAAALLRQFVDQSLHHLPTDAIAADVRSNGEIQDAQHGFVQFVDDESDDAVVQFGHGSDAVALAEAAEEFFLSPWELETVAFDSEYVVHIAADEPANLCA